MLLEQFLLDWRREKKLKKNFDEAQKTRPEYQIPGALKENVDTSRREAQFGELPGYRNALDRNDVAAANSLSAASEAGNALGMIPSIQANKSKADLDLETANADYRRQNLGMLYAANRDLAGAQDTAFQMNKFAPWADKYNMANNLTNLSYNRFTNLNKGMADLAMQVAGMAMGVPMTGGSGGSNFFGDQNMTFRDAAGR